MILNSRFATDLREGFKVNSRLKRWPIRLRSGQVSLMTLIFKKDKDKSKLLHICVCRGRVWGSLWCGRAISYKKMVVQYEKNLYFYILCSHYQFRCIYDYCSYHWRRCSEWKRGRC